MPIFKSLAERRSFWKRHVIACNESALSKASYCREHQLPYHQLIYWLSRCNTKTQPVAACAKPEPVAKPSKKPLGYYRSCYATSTTLRAEFKSHCLAG